VPARPQLPRQRADFVGWALNMWLGTRIVCTSLYVPCVRSQNREQPSSTSCDQASNTSDTSQNHTSAAANASTSHGNKFHLNHFGMFPACKSFHPIVSFCLRDFRSRPRLQSTDFNGFTRLTKSISLIRSSSEGIGGKSREGIVSPSVSNGFRG
jgi:hypothetical protein